MAAMIRVDVAHRLGRFELDARFETGGGITALFGRSGAGKTSIVNAVAGLLRPARGRIEIDDRVLVDTAHGVFVPAHRRRIGCVFQEGRLFPHMTVRQNLMFGSWFTPRAERSADARAIIAMLGLEDLLARRPAHLSGGEKQRVAIGRALLASPRLLVMDEPLASLDSPRKEEVLPYLERLRDDLRIPILYVSHALSEISRIADSIVLVSEGKVVTGGALTDVLARADLFPLTGRHEAGAIIDTVVMGHDERYELTVLGCPGGELRVPRIAAPPGARLRVRVRARDVILAVEPPRGLSTQTVLEGVIAGGDSGGGAIVDLSLDCGGCALIARVTRRSVETLGLVPGRRVWALVKTVAFDRRSLGHAAAAADEDASGE